MSATREGFLERIVRDPHDRALRLVYADWLEENGDPQLGAYIRARCAIDGCVPDAEAYPTLIERCLEAEAGQREPEFAIPEGFSDGCWWDAFGEEWWSDDGDCLEGGLLSHLMAEDADDDADPERVAAQIAEIVRTTPVRGFDFGWRFARQLPAILASPAGKALRRIALESRPAEGPPSSGLLDLAASPAARNIKRLEYSGMYYGPLIDPEAEALAAAPLEHLERLDLLGTECSPPIMERLQTAPWFRRLRRVRMTLNQGCAFEGARRLAGMPHLHTLGVWLPDDAEILGLGSTGEFPELRRLLIHCANLKGEQAAALARMNAPRLIELWLRNCAMGLADIKTLAASPLVSGLRVLTLDGVKFTHTALAPLAASPCAPHLRILRIRNAAMQSLAKSAIARPGVFPSLTTLALSSPYSGSAKKKDTAGLLAGLDLPRLRHLSLEYCGFDEECAGLIATRPTFAGLTRLIVRYIDDANAPTEKTLRKMLCSENLRNLVVLEMWSVPAGTAADAFIDTTVMPNLTRLVLDGVPEKLAKRVKAVRPNVTQIN